MNALVHTERQFTRAAMPEGELQHVRSLAKDVYLLLYLPMSLVPSATLMFAWMKYRDTAWSGVCIEGAIVMAVALWFAQLLMVPLLVEASHTIFGKPDASTAHHDVEFLEAFAPVLLMVTPLFLPCSLLFVYGIAASVVATSMLLFLGGYAIAKPGCQKSRGLSWLVVDLGFIGWAAIFLLVALI
jgi:hypothetical protein